MIYVLLLSWHQNNTPPPPALAPYFLYVLCFNLYVTIYMYIPNIMKPAWHNCINEYVWQTFLCKNKIFKKDILFLETTII